ncbi:GAF domain-containing protein [Ectothiorhodospiraceae bacterium WFHF3C12]|nr:GAF domain-containing protein [Ectothiorhodospiraceae bacterium WFHF3C12]
MPERAAKQGGRTEYSPRREDHRSGGVAPPASNGAILHLLNALSDAARRGHEQLFQTVEELVPQHLNVHDVLLVVREASDWTLWNDSTPNRAGILDSLAGGDFSDDEHEIMFPDGMMLLIIRPGELGLAVSPLNGYPLPSEELAIIARYLEAAISGLSAVPMEALRQNIISAFHRVATTVLHSEDLPEIFFNITEVAKSELAADISGIMLVQDEHLVMQRCVGNESADTARLEMAVGQGIGGRVLETGKPCFVENYVESSHISQHFFSLARVEKVRSALAAPMKSKDQIIGVLEVWRRRPSTFSDEDVTTLETLADLASIAIANASLIAKQKQTMRKLESANDSLRQRYQVIESSVDFQNQLMKCVLNNLGLDEIARAAGEALESGVFVFDTKTGMRSQYGANRLTSREIGALKVEYAKAPTDDAEPIELSFESTGSSVITQRISAVSGQSGWVGILNPSGNREWNLLSLASFSITVALHDMKSQAGAAALSEKTSALLWDLIDAPENVRRLAIDRLRELGIDMSRESCVVLCRIHQRGVASGPDSLSDRDLDIHRWLVRDVSARKHGAHEAPKLASMRGTEIAVVMPWSDPGAAAQLAEDIENQVAAIMPGVECSTGISARCHDPFKLVECLRQARLASRVAEMSSSKRPVAFEETGLIGIMMGLQEGTSFGDLPKNTLKELADDSKPQARTLRETLHYFLSLNCHQGNTAEALGVHPKTVAYRLEKIELATGLDLKSHEHRLLLELALKAHDLRIETL